MARVSVRRTWRERAVAGMLFVTLTPFAAGPVSAQEPGKNDGKNDQQQTETPIKHVIVLIGENRTFDHLFATYVPRAGIRSRTCFPKGSSKRTARRESTSSRPRSSRPSHHSKRSFYTSLDSDDKAPTAFFPSRL